jgi:hypothetical protein
LIGEGGGLSRDALVQPAKKQRATGTMKSLEDKLKQAGVKLLQPAFEVKWVPNADEIQKCFEFGRQFGEAVKE